jgi:hypothetical protein
MTVGHAKEILKSSGTTKKTTMVYLIHFEQKYKGVQHYLGYSADENFAKRIECHRKNAGARLMRAINLAGIPWEVVRTWPGMDGNFERAIKNQKNHACFCPKCSKEKKLQRYNRQKDKKQLICKEIM